MIFTEDTSTNIKDVQFDGDELLIINQAKQIIDTLRDHLAAQEYPSALTTDLEPDDDSSCSSIDGAELFNISRTLKFLTIRDWQIAPTITLKQDTPDIEY